MLSLGQNDALGAFCSPSLSFLGQNAEFSFFPTADSIEKDFRNAKEWLEKNDKNLRSVWTALQCAFSSRPSLFLLTPFLP